MELVANRLPDEGRNPEFEAADATLWLFEAARLFAETVGESHPFVTDELLLALRSVFEAALRGTKLGIRLTQEGLFAAGAPSSSVTWMDARVQGHAVTSRAGCAIELSALWAKGCETLANLADAAGDAELASRARAECLRTREAVGARFWCEETEYPYDVISEATDGPGAFRDVAVRPNAVIALAVDPACFSEARAAKILERAERELLTPVGLRTLSPSDPRYIGRYVGGVLSRDAAYHQGTVWPYLLGFFIRAKLKHQPRTKALEDQLEVLVRAAADNAIAVGQVPELAEGDSPYRGVGCVAQAWSVGELLRALVWDSGQADLASSPKSR